MAVHDLNELGTEQKRAVASYLDEVRSATLTAADQQTAEEVTEEVLAHILGLLDAESSQEDVRVVLLQLGPAGSFGSAAASEGTGGDAGIGDGQHVSGTGVAFGMPYDLRLPTAQRIARSWWNPQDERIFVPRLFGIGWSLNFGRIAVALGMIEPDAQDEPFCSTPAAAFRRALAIPVVIATVMLVTYAALRTRLGVTVPSHWNITGRPDDFWSTGAAFGGLFLLALVPTVWAVISVAAGRSRLSQGASLGFASFMASIAGAIWLLTLVTDLTSFAAWWFPPLMVIGALLVPFSVMLALAYAGRNEEIARDKGRAERSE